MKFMDTPSARRKAILFVVVGVCVFGSGCKDGSETIWSAEAPSPDGNRLASARTVANSGFGTGSIWTAVYLNWAKSSQPPTAILQFTDTFERPSDEISVEMKWLTPTHLEVAYGGTPDSRLSGRHVERRRSLRARPFEGAGRHIAIGA